MKVRIAKRFDFDAAHHLPHVPDGHKCKRVHGHTYSVEVVLVGEPQSTGGEAGMVCDYAKIALVWESLDRLLDHRDLNEIAGLENPTTEVLAPLILRGFILGALPVESVRVYESSSTWCEARTEDLPATAQGHIPV